MSTSASLLSADPALGEDRTPGTDVLTTAPARSGAAVLGRVLALYFTSRLVILGAAALSRLILVRGPFDDHARSLFQVFARWDTRWYLDIAERGYFSYHPDGESSAAFYPLLPLCIRALSQLGLDPLVAGYLVANACLIGAGLVLWRLTALETRAEGAADRAVLFLMFCPGAFWCGMIYTESLCLLLTLLSMWAARRRSWLWAGAAGYLAALTRTPGVFVAVFLGVEAFQQWRDDRRTRAAHGLTPPGGSDFWTDLRGRGRTLAGVLVPAAGQVTFLLFMQWRFGDWRAQQKTFAAGWHTPPFQWPWRMWRFNWERTEPFFHWTSFPLIALVYGFAVVALFTLRRKGYAVYVLALMTLLVSSTDYHNMIRYTVVIAPVYLLLGQVTNRVRALETPLLVLSTMLLTLLTALLASGYHIN